MKLRRKLPLWRPKTHNRVDEVMWSRLKALSGYHFRRKSPFKTFTLDFVEHNAGLVISLEDGEPGRRFVKQGSGHIVRDRLLSEQGYVILRLDRTEVARDLAGALHRIKAVLLDIAAPR
jgi:very-short-patch-repair endonuclease